MNLPKSLKALLCILTLLPLALTAPVFAAGPTCVAAGTTGLTTLVVATSGQYITGTFDATGCDVGIFVPPGSSNVVISGATVSGANIHAIFVQDSTYVIVDGNTVSGNGGGVPALSCDFIAPPHCISEGKAIQLSGTSYSAVTHNLVTNDLFGGIAVTDDGAIDPGGLNPGNANPANYNVVADNSIVNVSNDCGIVLATYNAESAINNLIFHNSIVGSPPPFGVNPYVGQIVIAGDAPDGTISGTVVFGNSITGSTLPGIVVHANAPGDLISNTVIWANGLSNNGYYPPFFSSPHTPVAENGTTAIALEAEAYQGMPNPPRITGTVVFWNLISNDHIGVWVCGTTSTTLWLLTPGPDINVVVCADGGS